jgi:drug/metabolite transporter (DMT)-like permease
VNPVVAVFLGWLVLGETISARTVLAAAIIVGAVALIVSARSGGSPSSGAKQVDAGDHADDAASPRGRERPAA